MDIDIAFDIHRISMYGQLFSMYKKYLRVLVHGLGFYPTIKPRRKKMRIRNDDNSNIMKILSKMNTKQNKQDNIEKPLACVDDEIKELEESLHFCQQHNWRDKGWTEEATYFDKESCGDYCKDWSMQWDLQRELMDMK